MPGSGAQGCLPCDLGVCVFLVAAALLPVEALGQVTGGHLTGRVTDQRTGAPVARAVVQVDDGRWRAVTDSAGRFRVTISEVPSDSVPVEVRHVAYRAWAEVVHPAELQEEEPLSVQLQPRAYRAPSLDVTVSRTELYLEDVGFFERRSEGEGHFLTADSLEARSYGRAEQVIRSNPGIRLRRFSSDEDLIFVDGRPIRRLNMKLEDLVMGRIAAVEAFRCSEAPLEYRRRADDLTTCSVVLIWRQPPGARER